MVKFKFTRFPAFFKRFYTAFSTKAPVLFDYPSENTLQKFRHDLREEVEDWESEEEEFERLDTRSGGSDEDDDEEESCICWHCGTRIKGRKFAGPFLF